MKLLVKKFTLRSDGVDYAAGSIVDLPKERAVALAQSAPLEFEIVGEAAEEAVVTGVAEVPEDGINLDDLTVAELKVFAEENGFDIGKATKKADIIDAIMNQPEDESELPALDAEATLK